MDSILSLVTGSFSSAGGEVTKSAEQVSSDKKGSLWFLLVHVCVFVLPLVDFTSDFVLISTVVIPSIQTVKLCATGDKTFKHGTWSFDGDDCGKVNRFTYNGSAGCTEAQRKEPNGDDCYDYTNHHPGFVNDATSPADACSGLACADNTEDADTSSAIVDRIGGIFCDNVPAFVTAQSCSSSSCTSSSIARTSLTSNYCNNQTTYQDCVKSYVTLSSTGGPRSCMWTGTPGEGACTESISDDANEFIEYSSTANCEAVYKAYSPSSGFCDTYTELLDCDSDQFVKCKTAYTFSGGSLPSTSAYAKYGSHGDQFYPAPVFDDDGYPTNNQKMCEQCTSCSDVLTYECGTRSFRCCMCQWPIATGETCCAQEGYKHIASKQCGGPGTCGKQVLVLHDTAPFSLQDHYKAVIWEKDCDAATVKGIDLTDPATCNAAMPSEYGYSIRCEWDTAFGDCTSNFSTPFYAWTGSGSENVKAAAIRRGQGFQDGWCGFRDYHQWNQDYWASNTYCESSSNGDFPIVYEHYLTGALGVTNNKCLNVFTTFGVDMNDDSLVVSKYVTNAAGIPLSCSNHVDSCADCGIFPFIATSQHYSDANGASVHQYMSFMLILLFCVVIAKEALAPVLIATAYFRVAERSCAKFKEIDFLPLASDSVVGFVCMVLLTIVGYESSYAKRMLMGHGVDEHKALVDIKNRWWYQYVWVPVDLVEVICGVVFSALWLWNVNEYEYEIPEGAETNIILVSWVLSMLDIWLYRIPSWISFFAMSIAHSRPSPPSGGAKVTPKEAGTKGIDQTVSLSVQTLDDIPTKTSSASSEKKKKMISKVKDIEKESTTASLHVEPAKATTNEDRPTSTFFVRIINAFLLAGYFCGFIMCSYTYVQTYLDRLDKCNSMDDGFTGMLTSYERTECMYCSDSADGSCPSWYYTV